MDNKKRYFELVGVASVVASLIFVGIEISQTTEATRSATVLQLKDSWVDLNLAYATSLELAAAEEEILTRSWDEIAVQNRILLGGAYRSLFHIWSNAYFQYRNGTLDESQWTPIMREITETMKLAGIQHVWADWGYVYEDEFRAIVDNEIPKDH